MTEHTSGGGEEGVSEQEGHNEELPHGDRPRAVGATALEAVGSSDEGLPITEGHIETSEHESPEERRIREGFEKAFTSPADFREVIGDDDFHEIRKSLQLLASFWNEKRQRDELDDAWKNHAQGLYGELEDLAKRTDDKVAQLEVKYAELKTAVTGVAEAIDYKDWDSVSVWRDKYKKLRAEIDAEVANLQQDISPLDNTVDKQRAVIDDFEKRLTGINEAEHDYMGAMESDEVLEGLIQWTKQHPGVYPGSLSSKVLEEIEANKGGVARRWRAAEMRETADRTRVAAQSVSLLVSLHHQYVPYIDSMDHMFDANHWGSAEAYEVAARTPTSAIAEIRGSTLRLKTATQSPAYATIS